MAIPGRINQSLYGVDNALSNTPFPTTFAMASLNTGWCARFMAPDTRDIASVYIAWNALSAAGTVQLRIETIDATTGKPTGSLYDANAVKSFTPSGTWQIVTFDVLPTTGLTAGVEYAIVLLTTVGGTTMTLRSSATTTSGGRYPCVVLTAADGTTRSNFAEVASAVPIATVVFEDSLEETPGGLFQFSTKTTYTVFGTAAIGPIVIVPAPVTLTVLGVYVSLITRTGTPAGDLRVRIFDSTGSTVAGTTVTADKDSLLNINGRRLYLQFPAPVNLVPGTYRIVFDSASSASGANCWTFSSSVARVSTMVPGEFNMANTADVTAGPVSWTDTATEQFEGGLVLDDLIGGATDSGGGVMVISPGREWNVTVWQ